ncbi:MAG: UDP-N-acetylglucosamine 2-epimerase (non-hydrolyzing) [bacterium]|uniref:UDP-N-acetylglucosamine 2-epimerase-like protein n=2 Tax=Bacteria candidate phyla TaxID=1783234 RepID=A0A101I3C9_UNCT6|nr:MAG: UDP-N-acetylglucosamine 2-epimerase-like protein [candidate division TA06 bacterium 32_111]KUK88021.1 MAG: UDP-N-acetylglucosamine 2-epimerase-like protein [candidate division TA06 bacterium 34_109]MDI6700825.1 UDP-N-acetylglucosamine 2-epimerase (non-hydrolyzing) [bacterium]HAF06949.1 UDP-N-acetylglucosamine 2-epimerase (non-hydrolyzing) [candidate division WOR-3 bacterium]HCP16863.1 UDP-N-acetylglucosamine 2-epimerase (non-hydrolyzing) [candidate division WOR-3 bacterium]
MKKIVVLVGARPQFIKHAPVNLELKKFFKLILVHSGQHYDYAMSEIFFKSLKLPVPDYNLEVGSKSHAQQTGEIMEKFENVLFKEKPNGVVVYGDTNTTLAGAITTAKLNIPLVHIESGLRSKNIFMPEEINRIVTDRISDYLFAPSKLALTNLKKEGLKGIFSGDVMFDLFLMCEKNIESRIGKDLKEKIEGKEFALLTIHRESNTEKETLKRILKNLSKLNYRIIFPVHPRTKNVLEGQKNYKNIEFIQPIGYFETIYLLKRCRLVLTDSGGLQKEAYFARKLCVTLRGETEWEETVKAGYNILSPFGENVDENIEKNFKKKKYENFYGHGNASKIIASKLKESL